MENKNELTPKQLALIAKNLRKDKVISCEYNEKVTEWIELFNLDELFIK